MTRGTHRTLIPLSLGNLATWPTPDATVFPVQTRELYEIRRRAVEMYASGYSYQKIKEETGTGEHEVRRLVKRCVVGAPDGQIFGFHALVPNVRLAAYVRTSPVNRFIGSGKGGCAGALTQLFSKHPQVKDLIDRVYLGGDVKQQLPEQQIPIRSLWKRFKKELSLAGLTDYDWPFNTHDCGYRALSEYCKKLRFSDFQRAALPRAGEEAKRRGGTNTGISSLISALRPFTYTQLDFHKVDAATVITIDNDYGVTQSIVVSRWYIGFLVDEYSGAVLGAYVALEMTPSGDATLEIIESALRPADGVRNFWRTKPTGDGKFLIHELMPELEYHAFSVLKVDNAWSNAATEVVNNIMDVVGCAVNFGPVRAWWRRSLIERIFKKLTNEVSQRLPSTHGSGPGDSRVAGPHDQAIKYKFRISDLVSAIYEAIKLHNVQSGQGLQYSAPREVLQAALDRANSGYIPQPLPKSTQQSMWLLMHVEEVTVRGSLDRNERPFFINDRWRYSNELLANSPWLIGETIVIYVDRRKCSTVYATVKKTGQPLGLMYPPQKWANTNLSWRDRKLINRAGQSRMNHEEPHDPLDQIKTQKYKEAMERPKSKRKHSSKAALDLARLHVQEAAATPVEHVEKDLNGAVQPVNKTILTRKAEQTRYSPSSIAIERSSIETDNVAKATDNDTAAAPVKRDPFGLDDIPEISFVKRIK